MRRKLLRECDVHTGRRLPTGIFYADGEGQRAVLRLEAAVGATADGQVLDLRLPNQPAFTLKARALARTDLDDFVTRYNPANRHERTETERFRAFSCDELMAAATSQDPRANEAVGPKNSSERPVLPSVAWAAHERRNGQQQPFVTDQ
jgi:hypothetical protein